MNPPTHSLRRRDRPKGDRGFTVAEVLLSLVVFAISVVGLVAMERRGVEAQLNAMEHREAERLAQDVMSDLMSTGFNEFVRFNFAGGSNPTFPYSDFDAGADTAQIRGFRQPPREIPSTPPLTGSDHPPGEKNDFYRIGRQVSAMPVGVVPGGDPTLVDSLQLDVWVLWLDNNPILPPPVSASVNTLVPANIDPTNTADYKPYVRGVHLRTVRVNDAVVEAP